jgi:hypothetical protein
MTVMWNKWQYWHWWQTWNPWSLQVTIQDQLL